MSVFEKTKLNKCLVTITDLNQIAICKKARITNFLFPLKDFCVGVNNTFSLDEISEGYLYINRVLDHIGYQTLKKILRNIPKGIQGILFEDFGVIQIVRELQLDIQLILYQTHFATNYESINANLNYVDSIVIGTDITASEVTEILEKAKKPLVYLTYGMVPGMYSRRFLLSNFEEEFDTPKKNKVFLQEQVTKKGFLAVENEYGTVLYHDKYLNSQSFLPQDNILFYWFHPLFLNLHELEELFLRFSSPNIDLKENEDTGFLEQKTIYRLKGD